MVSRRRCDSKACSRLGAEMKIEEFAHAIYSYRTFHGIEGDEHGDKEIAREFLEHVKRGSSVTFEKFVYDKFEEDKK